MGERSGWLAVVCGILAPSAVLVATLTPTVLDGDSANFARQAHRFGLAHPPGYPLVAMIGKAVTTCVPFGDAGWRAHWVAALGGVASLALAYALMRRWGAGRLPAAAGCWLLAFSPLFWSQSVQINPYILGTAFALGLFLLLDLWAERRGLGLLGAAAGLYGFGMGGHPSLALYLPAVGVFVAIHLWRDDARRKMASLAVGLGAAALGCLPWLLVTLTHLPEGADLAGFLTAKESPSDWRVFFLGVVSPGYVKALAEHVLATFSQFSLVGVLLAAIGAVALARKRRVVFLLVALGYLAQMNFACTLEHWHAFDVYRLPTHTLTAVLAGVGLHAICVRLSPRGRIAAVAGALALSLGPPYLLLARSESANPVLRRLRPQMPFREEFAKANRADCLAALEGTEPGSTLLTTWGPYATLRFLQDVEGVGTDVQALSRIEFPVDGPAYVLVRLGRPLSDDLKARVDPIPVFETYTSAMYRVAEPHRGTPE